MPKKILSLLFIGFLFSPLSFAKKFASQYCEFELPPGWECALEGTEWVCQSSNKDRQKEAIIILAAKIRGPQDSLEEYQAYLKATKTYKLPGGKTQVSEPKVVEAKAINNHQWVDALHMASEVPGFYTRYLATVKEDLGVAVTLTVAKDFYSQYQSIFDKIVSTLRVFRQRPVVADMSLKKKEESLLDDTSFIPDSGEKYGIGQRKKGGGEAGGLLSNPLILILILAGAGGAFFYFKKKKAGSGEPPKDQGPPPTDQNPPQA
jgi:hypothetical protein